MEAYVLAKNKKQADSLSGQDQEESATSIGGSVASNALLSLGHLSKLQAHAAGANMSPTPSKPLHTSGQGSPPPEKRDGRLYTQFM